MSLTALEIFSVLMRKIKQVLSTNKKSSSSLFMIID